MRTTVINEGAAVRPVSMLRTVSMLRPLVPATVWADWPAVRLASRRAAPKRRPSSFSSSEIRGRTIRKPYTYFNTGIRAGLQDCLWLTGATRNLRDEEQ